MNCKNVTRIWLVVLAISIFSVTPLNAKDLIQGRVVLASAEEDSVVTVEVKVEELPLVYGFELEIQFNPQQLSLIPLGGHESRPLAPSPFMSHPQQSQLDNQIKKGVITYSMSRLHPAPPVSGSGTLTLVRFEKLNGSVDTLVKVSKLKFGTEEGEVVKPDLKSAELTINSLETSVFKGSYKNLLIKGLYLLLLLIVVITIFIKLYVRKKAIEIKGDATVFNGLKDGH